MTKVTTVTPLPLPTLAATSAPEVTIAPRAQFNPVLAVLVPIKKNLVRLMKMHVRVAPLVNIVLKVQLTLSIVKMVSHVPSEVLRWSLVQVAGTVMKKLVIKKLSVQSIHTAQEDQVTPFLAMRSILAQHVLNSKFSVKMVSTLTLNHQHMEDKISAKNAQSVLTQLQTLLVDRLALPAIYVSEVPTPTHLSQFTITEAKFAPRALTVLKDLLLRNCVLLEPTTKTLVLALSKSALCALLVRLMLTTVLKDATHAVNSLAVLKDLKGALVLEIIEFTHQLTTHADADQASILRMPTALVKVNPQMSLTASPLFSIVVMEKVKLELLTASVLR